MASIFTSPDVVSLLKHKLVLFFGGSNFRALYKDLVWLINQNSLINNCNLRRKLERTYMGDKLVKSTTLTASRDFYEERSFEGFQISLRFCFLTRCYCDVIIECLRKIRMGEVPPPDVIIMNSCLWDICRWGPTGVEDYKMNMCKLMNLLRRSLPSETLFIWTTALPVSQTIRGGLLVKQIGFMEKSLRFHIMEANLFTTNLVNSFGFDVVDFHYHIQFQTSRRSHDGVHYLPLPVRLLTNLYLTHIALSWGRRLPPRGDILLLNDEKDLAQRKTPELFTKKSVPLKPRAKNIALKVSSGPKTAVQDWPYKKHEQEWELRSTYQNVQQWQRPATPDYSFPFQYEDAAPFSATSEWPDRRMHYNDMRYYEEPAVENCMPREASWQSNWNDIEW